jgi:fimbrial isopeptide formation D2 family protein/uncharacterized repeat protein (TIGR01451 family)
MLIRSLFLLPLVVTVILAAPIPSISGNDPGVEMIGEAFSTQVCFENRGTLTGFEPGIEVVTPSGVEIATVLFSDANLSVETTTVGRCLAADTPPCSYINPDNGHERTNVDENETFYSIRVPLGSVTTEMPQQCVTIKFTLGSSAEVTLGVAEHITLQPWFNLGADAQDNPVTDPPVAGSEMELNVVPSVFKVSKNIAATEGETATGKNFPHRVSIDVDIAKDEKVTGLIIQDRLPLEMKYMSGTIHTSGCAPATLLSEPNFSTTQLLKIDCSDEITGHSGAQDVVVSFDIYIPDEGADGKDIIDHRTGSWKEVRNSASAKVSYSAPGVDVNLTDEGNATITAKPITIYKAPPVIINDNPTPGFSPDDILEYKLTIDLSDYFNLQEIVIEDILEDGLLFFSPVAPKFTLEYDTNSYTDISFDSQNYTISSPDTQGATTLTLHVSNQLKKSNINLLGRLKGDDASNSVHDGVATKMVITYRVEILKEYRVKHHGSKIIKASDVLLNRVSMESEIPGGDQTPDERSAVSVTIPTGTFTKSIYKINGSDPGAQPYKISPNDIVTFRLKADIIYAEFTKMKLSDYFPIPFFDVSNGGSWQKGVSVDGNYWEDGPEHNLSAPTQDPITVNTTQNMLEWHFADPVEATENQGGVIDILVHIKATDKPMSDALKLTNVSYISFENSDQQIKSDSGYIQVITKEPELKITKVITSATEGTLETGLSGDYTSLLHKAIGDTSVNYEINITNIGSLSAYDVVLEDIFLQDNLPHGLYNCSDPSLSGGVGATWSRTDNNLSIKADQITDASSLLVTYQCHVDPAYSPGKDIVNRATLKHYTNGNNGPNFVSKDISSATKIDLKGVISIDKDIYHTSLNETGSNTSVNQGELVDFNMTLVLSVGTYYNFAFNDTLCPSLIFDDNDTASVSGSDLVVSGSDATMKFHCDDYIAKATGETNTIIFSADNIEDAKESVAWSVAKPPVATNKTMTPHEAYAGQSITGFFEWKPTYNADHNNPPVFQCKVEDNLSKHDGLYNFSTFSFLNAGGTPEANPYTTPEGYICSFDSSSGVITCKTQNYDTNQTVCPNGNIHFSITTDVNATLGTSYPNDIFFEGKTLPPDHYTGSNITEGDVIENNSGKFKLKYPKKPLKTIVETSENHTDPGSVHMKNKPPVAIGEVITYEIKYEFPSGITNAVILKDKLLGSLWAQYVFESMEIKKSSDHIVAGVHGTDTPIAAAINAAASGTYIAVSDTDMTLSPVGTPRVIKLSLGNVQNQIVGSGYEGYTIRFRMKVRNDVNSQAGNTKQNIGRLLFQQEGGHNVTLSSARRNVFIATPYPTISKVTTNGLVFEASDSVTYKLQICNADATSYTTAFDWNITDILPSKLSGLAITSVTAPAYASAHFTFATPQRLEGSIDKLNPADCVEVIYDAKIAADAEYGLKLLNRIQFTTTSLPGPYGASQVPILGEQSPGQINGERTGDGSGANMLHGNDSFEISIAQAKLYKSLENPQPYYPIGSEATYVIIVGTPKGSANDTKVRDQLPKGLKYVDGSEHVVAIPSGAALAYTFTHNNGLLTWDFGDIIVSDDALGKFEYNVTVENVLSNQDATLLQNSASVSYIDPNTQKTHLIGPIKSDEDIRVGEPDLEISKRTLSYGKEAGDSVSYEIVIKNGGHTTAYDVNWSDILPSNKLAGIHTQNLILHGPNATLSGTTTPLEPSHLNITTTAVLDDTITLPGFDLPVGSEVHISFDATIQSGILAGTIVNNVTSGDYISLLTTEVRDGKDSCNDDDDSTLNNYCEKGSSQFKFNVDVSLDKYLDSPVNTFSIGEEVRYRLRLKIPQATLVNARLSDIMPVGLSYVSHSITLGNAGISYTGSGDNSGSSSNEVIIDFIQITNPDNGDRDDDYIDIELIAKVNNIASNQNGVILSNGSSRDGVLNSPVYFDYLGQRVYFDSDPDQAGYQGVDISIVEPHLIMQKSVSPVPQTRNDIVTYHFKLYHDGSSTADAYDLNFTDILPVGVDYIYGSEIGIKLKQNGRTLSASTDVFAQSSRPYTFSYQAKISAAVDPTKKLINKAELKYASIIKATGTVDGGRNGMDGTHGLNDYITKTEATVIANATASIILSKSANRSFVTTSDREVEFTLTIENNGTLDVNITSLWDNKFGDVTTLTGNTCNLPKALAIGQSYHCTFLATIPGDVGEIHINEANATAIDRAGNVDYAYDTAYVSIIDATDSVIGQRIWLDNNANGMMDHTEKGIDGVTVSLYQGDYCLGKPVATKITANGGFYLFNNLGKNTYTVCVTDTHMLLSNMMLTTPPEPRTIDLSASSQVLDANFGYTEPQIVVSKSANVSTVNAGVSGGDVTYYIEVKNVGGSVVRITSLDDDTFGDLTAISGSTCKTGTVLYHLDSYRCEFTHHFSGYDAGDTHTNTVTVTAKDSEDNTASQSDNETIVFVDGINALAGLLIYYDANGNGAYDSGEPGLDSVNVIIADKYGNTVDTTVSSHYLDQYATSGLYLFSGLAAGEYIIYTKGGQPTWRAVTPEDPDGGYVYTGGNSAQIPFKVSAGQTFLQANFGFAISDIAVSKYANVTTVTPPSGDVTYTIVVKNSGGIPVVLDSLIDDKFGDLNTKGSCTLPQNIAVAQSYSCSFTETVSGEDGDVHTNTVTASAHDSDGYHRSDSASRDIAISEGIHIDEKSIGDSVYWDKNNNGIFDGGDEGFDDVTVELRDSNNSVLQTQTTTNGHYLFSNLNDDIYSVVITDEHHVLDTFTLSVGTDPHTDIKIDRDHQIYLNIDFGYRKSVQVPLFTNMARTALMLLLFFGAVIILRKREQIS